MPQKVRHFFGACLHWKTNGAFFIFINLFYFRSDQAWRSSRKSWSEPAVVGHGSK